MVPFVRLMNWFAGPDIGLLRQIALVALGVAALLWGRGLLRLAARLIFAGAAAVGGAFLVGLGVDLGWLPDQAVSYVAIALPAAVLGWALPGRLPTLCRWGEVLAVAAAALVALPNLAATAGNAIPVILFVGVLAAVAARSTGIGLIASIALGLGLEIDSIALFGGLAGVCFLAAWMRFGRPAAPAVRLRREGGRGGFGLLAAAVEDRIKVVLGFDREAEAESFRSRCAKSKTPVRSFKGLDRRILEVEISRLRALALQRVPSLVGLFSAAPTVVAESKSIVRIDMPTKHGKNAVETISLEEIQQWLCTGRDGSRFHGKGGQGAGIEVVVIDTGDDSRPEYSSQLVHRESCVPHEGPEDLSECRHGSNCMMIISALASRARLVSIKAFSAEGRAQLVWIIEALSRAAQRTSVGVISASWGGCACQGANTCLLCRSANSIKTVFSASAGNGGREGLSCPGAARAAIATASCDRQGVISAFSSRGPSVDPANPKPDLTAYGEGVMLRTATRGKNDVPMNGTSFSAPQTSAAAACILGVAKACGKDYSRDAVKRILRRTANPNRLARGSRSANDAGAGLLNIADACRMAAGRRPETAPASRRWHGLLPMRRGLATAAAVVVAISLSAYVFALDHGCRLAPGESGQEVRMLGRVRETGGYCVFDDGTATIPLGWRSPDDMPGHGALVYMVATLRPGRYRQLDGLWSLTLWPSTHDEAAGTTSGDANDR